MGKPVGLQGFSATFTLEQIVMADSVNAVSAIVRRLNEDQVAAVINAARTELLHHINGEDEVWD